MRLERFGNKGLVSSAEVSVSKAGLHLLVNLRERWAPGFCRGSSMHFICATANGPTPLHDTWVFSDPDADSEEAEHASEVEVVIVAETKEDEALLKGMLRYHFHEKDQFTALYVPADAFLYARTLATTEQPSPAQTPNA